MSVSRDFIDSYSPEVPGCTRGSADLPMKSPLGADGHRELCDADDGLTKLAFRFQITQDLRQLAVAVRQRRTFVLALPQEGFQGLMQPDRLVDLGAGTRPVGPEPDQFLH